MIKYVLLNLLVILPSICIDGVDLSDYASVSSFGCIKGSKYLFAVIRSYLPDGTIDQNAKENLNNARATGLSTDIYISPCKALNPKTQVDRILSSIPPRLYHTVWVKVQPNSSPGCSWQNDYVSNCNFLTEIINRIKMYGKPVGIYSSPDNWQSIMGSLANCFQSTSTLPLWYIQNNQNLEYFEDFRPFGRWDHPTMKQQNKIQSGCGITYKSNIK